MGRGTFSTFWTGRFGPYQRLCLASWIAHGHKAVVYTPDADIELPQGAEKRPAEEILNLGGHVYHYKTGIGEGSPSLHSNLFRYKLLLRGEWWLDADVVVNSDHVPEHDYFVAWQRDKIVGTAVMRFPAESAVMLEAIAESLRVIDKARWTEIGPGLVTRLIEKHGLKDAVADRSTTYAIHYTEVIKFFDPAAREEVVERVASSTFVHLWNQIWTIIGFPHEFGPPEGSYLDALFRKYDDEAPFPARVPFASIRTWCQNHDRIGMLQRELREARKKIEASPMVSFRKP